MQTTESEVKSASHWAWAAARDARQRSLAAQSHYSQAQQVQAERMSLVMPLLYHNSGVFINYRQKFIAVKINGARVRDNHNLDLFESDWSKAGVKKLLTNQGIVYRIPKV